MESWSVYTSSRCERITTLKDGTIDWTVAPWTRISRSMCWCLSCWKRPNSSDFSLTYWPRRNLSTTRRSATPLCKQEFSDLVSVWGLYSYISDEIFGFFWWCSWLWKVIIRIRLSARTRDLPELLILIFCWEFFKVLDLFIWVLDLFIWVLDFWGFKQNLALFLLLDSWFG